MRSLLKVTRVITLLSFLITLSYVRLHAQNTAPVPTTFEILSPADGNLPFLINNDYGTAAGKNHTIFYGGDFYLTGAPTATGLPANKNAKGFLGYPYGGAVTTNKAQGNPRDSRLTLGGTEKWNANPSEAVVVNLPGYHSASSFDIDDVGAGVASQLNYKGANGFIAINEEDSLVIRLTGYVDPNNTQYVGSSLGIDQSYDGALLRSNKFAFDLAHPGNDTANGVLFGVVPSSLPDGATFSQTLGLFSWVPNFIQGDGGTDNSVHGGYYFVDANISNGTTTSSTNTDTSSAAAVVGRGVGELKDSLYVILFSATDDGIPSMTGVDSLFIMVNDSIQNPPPIFTKREVINRQGQLKTYTKSSVQFSPDSMLTYYEGDSIVVTFYAMDQDSIRGGGSNNALTFLLPRWNNFIHRLSSHVDSTALDTSSVLTNGTPTAFRVRLRLPFNLANDPTVADTLIVRVNDGNGNTPEDTMLFSINNTNRAPIWDADTSSKPGDSTLTFSADPASVDVDSIDAFTPIAVANAKTDTIYFAQYVYDPDVLIGDSLGASLSFDQTGSPSGSILASSGLMILTLTSVDTTSYGFTIKATDSNTTGPLTASKALVLRVAPQPAIASVHPATAYPGQNITIFGSGFGLFDGNSSTPSKVLFRARNSSGTAQNLRATIVSWSRDRIVLTIPSSTPISTYKQSTSEWIPDTIQVSSAVFATPVYYPYVISDYDSTTASSFTLANLTSTSATITWKTPFTGIDSLVLAYDTDTLIFANNTDPSFKIKSALAVSSAVHVYHGTSSTTDQMHSVTITDLVPSTIYRFFLGMQSGLFFGDSSGRLNGPFKPAKIDRVVAANNNGIISGFRFITTPSAGAAGETFVVEGDAYSGSGAAVNALVTVRIVDYTNVADTSLPLTATVKSDSSWIINLGDAVTDTFGVADRVFHHKQGDYLVISVDGGSSVGYQQFVATRGADSPQRLDITSNGISLAPSVAYDVLLKTGLNLIGLPVQLFNGQPNTAHGILLEIAGGLPSITTYNSGTGTQSTISRVITGGSNGFIGTSDYTVELYKAYFIKSDQEQYITFNGSSFGDTLPPITFTNAALYWISRPAQTSTLFYGWSARTMLSNIANASQIFRYNEVTQQLESAIIDPNTGAFVASSDFHIDVSEGYIIDITAASQWDINTPSAVLLANADAKFNGLTENTPSLTLNTAKAGEVPEGSASLRNMRLTDVTSTAATLSWMTDVNSPALVRYGKVGESLSMTAYFDSKVLDGGMRMVQLLNLKPQTEYAYEIVSNGVTYNNNGQPFVLTSAKVGIGLPYTVFGRLLDEKGNPLSKAMVYFDLKEGQNISAPLMAITNEQGYWNVNLANLKTAGGDVFGWNAGDEIRVSTVFQNASSDFRSLVSGQSPQNMVKVEDLSGMVESQKQAVQVALPKAFALGQNYPNPFNPSTTISFDVPDSKVEGVNVELKVYNIRGQLVKNLVDEVKQPGHFVVQWNGRDEKGEVTASGVYFYRIKAGDFVTTRKMVLLK